ncbi:hypothetical protein DVH24_011644 [Malus domestica]|uniref:Protein kinase domain-containing protein n=1 Tax=Malus domestica TaxID=3750 RepID=A0A498JTV1_MALDO|nr:hypothetical protein DVH24_011644 [Malus domestica]
MLEVIFTLSNETTLCLSQETGIYITIIWDLWTEGKVLDIIDSSLNQSYSTHEVKRYIQIGLLCVQEYPTDWTTMLDVVFMLGNETTLPCPKKAAFSLKNSGSDSSTSKGASSINDVTVTNIEAHALWREGNALEIVESSLGELYLINEVARCLQIALLCLTEYATERPTMSAVVFMLGFLNMEINACISAAQHAKKSNSSFGKKRKLEVSVACGLLFFLLFSLACWLVKRKRKGKRSQDKFFNVTIASTSWEDSSARTNIDESGINSELPFFELSTIVKATNNFTSNNKLGTGGFGSVYKGVLDNGKEIAVKRLAKNSGQGIGEFKNEVVLLSKLQHRNLVRIMGCCVQDEEKMLIYEYLPNKSLDFFIFGI